MDLPFFIMMYHPKGYAMPIIGDEDDVLFFETEENARFIAERHDACMAYGYEIFEMGTGL